MVGLQIIIEAHDPFPAIECRGVVHEIKLHVIEMGLAEFSVFIPIKCDGVNLDLREKNVVSVDGNHH